MPRRARWFCAAYRTDATVVGGEDVECLTGASPRGGGGVLHVHLPQCMRRSILLGEDEHLDGLLAPYRNKAYRDGRQRWIRAVDLRPASGSRFVVVIRSGPA